MCSCHTFKGLKLDKYLVKYGNFLTSYFTNSSARISKRFFCSANILVKKSHAVYSMARESRRAELKGRGIKSTWILIQFRNHRKESKVKRFSRGITIGCHQFIGRLEG